MKQIPGGGNTPPLPAALARLDELAHNLWWTWQPEAVELFRSLDPARWDSTGHNPIRILASLSSRRLQNLARNEQFVQRLEAVLVAFDAYMHPAATWYAQTFPGDQRRIAYFCAEFGLHESLPIYSGGLGVLAGDHCKTASDLGLPFVAVGLFYKDGYFKQQVTASGEQIAQSEDLDQHLEPLRPAGPEGSDLLFSLPLPGREIQIRVWQVQVGRVSIYLLDTDVEGNAPEDRVLGAHLYGGDRETRIAQEVILGVGGVRALRLLGITPTVWHMNEGHAAFMGLERIRELVASGVPFTEAWPEEAESSVFTTHTPVPAGNEVFRHDLVLRYLPDMAAGMGLDTPGFLALAKEEDAPVGTFAMTPLAIRLSHRANGVSALHGKVARRMWAKQFPHLPEDEVPITSITNGVHTGTWISPQLGMLHTRYVSPTWLQQVDDPQIWEAVDRIPDAELWAVHLACKQAVLKLIRERQRAASAAAPAPSAGAFTIGFARRFASYKRATLFFHDLARAERILRSSMRPVQIVFAGKAHPADGSGQSLIKELKEFTTRRGFAGRVFFLEGYDMGLARSLVQGVDLWLNNPERPQEASGTSGQKAALNGVPNLSIRDGWWDEGYDGQNGWAFGGEVGNDDFDSADLYRVLEQEVIPTFFARDDDGLPRQWLAVMKSAIRTLTPAFSAQRMVKEYTTRFYTAIAPLR